MYIMFIFLFSNLIKMDKKERIKLPTIYNDNLKDVKNDLNKLFNIILFNKIEEMISVADMWVQLEELEEDRKEILNTINESFINNLNKFFLKRNSFSFLENISTVYWNYQIEFYNKEKIIEIVENEENIVYKFTYLLENKENKTKYFIVLEAEAKKTNNDLLFFNYFNLIL